MAIFLLVKLSLLFLLRLPITFFSFSRPFDWCVCDF